MPTSTILAVARLNRRRIRRLWNSVQEKRWESVASEARSFFHWSYSSVLIVFCLGTVLAMIGIALAVEPFGYLFRLARLFALLGFIWSLAFWLTSEELEGRKPKLTKKQKKRGEKPPLTWYRFCKWGMVIFICYVFYGSLRLISKVEASREVEVFQRDLSSPETDLIPAGEPSPPTTCHASSDSFRIYAGDSLAYYEANPPYNFISSASSHIPRFVVEKANGHLAITTDIYARDRETVLASIEKNHVIRATGGEILSVRHPDKSTLTIIDKYKKTVFSIHYINEKAIKISGTFYYPDAAIDIGNFYIGGVTPAGVKVGRMCFGGIGVHAGMDGIDSLGSN